MRRRRRGRGEEEEEGGVRRRRRGGPLTNNKSFMFGCETRIRDNISYAWRVIAESCSHTEFF